MKAAFSVEAIGWNGGILGGDTVPYGRRGSLPSLRPWLAELTGVSSRYGWDREFLRAKVDFADANRPGTRGVRCWWTLETGRIYETRYRVTWDSWRHRYLRVTDGGEIVELTEEEVTAWASASSASMC